MKLASCPGRGLCLSHARLDLRHFIALTLPLKVTAALNEAPHMCSDQVGHQPGIHPSECRRLNIFTLAHRRFRALYGVPNVCAVLFIPQRSEGPHSVSSRDNGVPSVTRVRITEHNSQCSCNGGAGQATVVKLPLGQIDLASVATSAYFPQLYKKRRPFLNGLFKSFRGQFSLLMCAYLLP